ncbi:hypothetical protein GCM10025854_25660 [Tetragenococcus muriaticus]|nr:hypothetical protein GCM10025854_25660 [Tetragenococcus muriaticus]
MANIYDTANQLEGEIRELDQFKELSASFAELKKMRQRTFYLKNSNLSNKNYNKRCRKEKT